VKAAEEIARDMESERTHGTGCYAEMWDTERPRWHEGPHSKRCMTESRLRFLFRPLFSVNSTTITFKGRFSAFPVKIEYISRFKPKKGTGCHHGVP